MRSRLTYANVVSSLALFLALGGVSWAAVTLPRNSVGARQIKPNAVTSDKIADRTLQRSDFAAGALPAAGPAGATGATGSAGPAGPAGARGERGPAGDLFDDSLWTGAALPASQAMALTIDGFEVFRGTSYRSECTTASGCTFALGGQFSASIEPTAWFEQARDNPAAARRSFSLALINTSNSQVLRRFHVTGGIPTALLHQSDDFLLVYEATALMQISN
jgi:hypothetical protein